MNRLAVSARRNTILHIFLLFFALTLLSACGRDGDERDLERPSQGVGWEAIPTGPEGAAPTAPQAAEAGSTSPSAETSRPEESQQGSAAEATELTGDEDGAEAPEGEGTEASEEEKEAEVTPEASDGNSKHAGKYHSFGAYLNGRYYRDDVVKGWSLELNPDGQGYLYLGEKHQGPVSAWQVSDAGALSVTAGSKTFAGASHLENGVLRLDFGDGMVIAFASSEEVIAGLDISTP